MSIHRLAPLIFAFLWSTGWIAAKYGSFYAGPLSFLSVRFAVAMVFFLIWCAISKIHVASFRPILLHSLISGAMIHGLYLAAIWWAIAQGVPAGYSGIIAALQPLLTAVAAGWILRECLSRLQVIGLIIGFIGIAIAILPKLLAPGNVAFTIFSVAINLLGIVSVTAGAIYQKRFLPSGDIRVVASVQYFGALLVVLPLALIAGDTSIEFTAGFFGVLAWSVLANSVGAALLLMYLLRRDQATKAASLIYLVPGFAALQAFVLFSERFSLSMLIGAAIAIVGVFLANLKGSGSR